MYIELINKTTHWYGTSGVVLNIKIGTTTDSGYRVIDVQTTGITQPITTMTCSDKYFVIPNVTIIEWLNVKGYPQKWETEARGYRAALSKVDLPFSPRHSLERSYLSYRLIVADDPCKGLHDLDLVLTVKEDLSYLAVYLGSYEYDGMLLSNHIITGDINLSTLKAAVKSVVDKHIEDLRTLVELPMKEVVQ